MPQTDSEKNPNGSLYLNAAIGFLSLLLIVLVIGLLTRIVFPRIFNERADLNTNLITDIIQLEVLNGCGVDGVANLFTSLLRENGFDVVETGNFERFDVEESFVISRSSTVDNARRVANALGIPLTKIIREESSDFYLDVTVILGSDYTKLNMN